MNKKKRLDFLYQMFSVIKQDDMANIDAMESIESFLEDVQDLECKKILESVHINMKKGIEFDEALNKHPSLFPAYIVQIIRVCSELGQRGQAYHEIVLTLKQEIKLHRSLTSGLWGVKFFMVGLAIASAIAVFIAIPAAGRLMKTLNAELPIITKCVLGISDVLVSFWWVFILCGILVGFYYQWMKKNNPASVARLAMKIPFFNELNDLELQYRFAKIYGLCRRANVEPRDALVYTAHACDNILLKNILLRAANNIRAGMDIVPAIQKADTEQLLHKVMYRMLKAGAASGTNTIMLDVADDYRDKLIDASKTVSEKVGTAVLIPGNIMLIVLLISIEYPILTQFTNMKGLGM